MSELAIKKYCTNCGELISALDKFCSHCGVAVVGGGGEGGGNGEISTSVTSGAHQINVHVNVNSTAKDVEEEDLKSKVVAGVLALFLGGLGIHKFYCGRIGTGIVYLIFFWTFIPAIVGFIEGIIYLVQRNDKIFTKKYCY